MTTREHINEYFNGRPFMILCALALMVATVVAVMLGVRPVTTDGNGMFFSLGGRLVEHGRLSAVINVLCLLATGGIMLALNKVFAFVRSVTHLCVSAFFLLQLANPSGLVAFNIGTLLAAVTAVATMPLFASFQDRHSQRSIFLIFAMVAMGTMFDYSYLMLIPAFLLGFINMGVFNLKGVLAMLFGLFTPFWIVLGLGIASPSHFAAPHIQGIWHATGHTLSSPLFALSVVTAVLGIVLAVLNLMTIMNYRMQTRVYNAFFVFVLIMVVIALCIDYSHVASFLPLLGLMTAVQVAHAHTLRTASQHRYIFIVLLCVGSVAFCAANLML